MNRLDRVRLQASIDKNHFIPLVIQVGAQRHQAQRHGEEFGLGIVEQDLEALSRRANLNRRWTSCGSWIDIHGLSHFKSFGVLLVILAIAGLRWSEIAA